MIKSVRPNAFIVAGLAGAILAVVSAPQLSTAALAVVDRNGAPYTSAAQQTTETGWVQVADAADDKKKKKKKRRRKGGGGSYQGS